MKRKVFGLMMALCLLCYTLIFYADTNGLSSKMNELKNGRLRFQNNKLNLDAPKSLNPERHSQSAVDRLNTFLKSLEEKSRKIQLTGYHGAKYASLIARINETKIISVEPGRSRGETRNAHCGHYWCALVVGGPINDVDMVVFTTRSMEAFQSPPRKPSNDIWAFKSKGSQWINVQTPSLWDGMFNYSLTYLAGTEGANHSFADKLRMRVPQLTRNFAELRNQRRLNALWLVSHCAESQESMVTSARDEYVNELAKYIDIDVFTGRGENCKEHLDSPLKDELDDEPEMSSYSFYLSFENSLCKDYISEKLWKVLEADVFTIPIVLGGLSIEEYERVAPPNSFIHVKNFTSPKALAMHLYNVAYNDDSYNYYLQWRNEYILTDKERHPGSDCHLCRLAHERPKRVWDTFSKDFGSHNCLNVTSQLCPYYNISC